MASDAPKVKFSVIIFAYRKIAGDFLRHFLQKWPA